MAFIASESSSKKVATKTSRQLLAKTDFKILNDEVLIFIQKKVKMVPGINVLKHFTSVALRPDKWRTQISVINS